MPSPFPGMDPYLENETLWPSFQHQLVLCLYQILLPGLVDRYRPRVGQRHYAPEHTEEFIEIRQRTDGKFITLIDVVSPANKTTAVGREAYLDTRKQAKLEGANAVEVDVVLQGQPTLEYSRDGLPKWDYAVTVTRSAKPEQFEIYTATLQKRLPRFRVPLAADDRETVLDLQTAVARCYDQGSFASKIDYTRDPTMTLTQENKQWIDEFLKHNNLRGQPPQRAEGGAAQIGEEQSHEKVAVAAYYLWQKEGCPHGRDKEHWHRAMEQLNPQSSDQPRHKTPK